MYSFSVADRDGLDITTADDDNDTEFSLTGQTKDSGKLAFRMTYRMQSESYFYYKDSDLKKMTDDEKKAAKKYLIEEEELDEGKDFGKNMTQSEAEALAKKELKNMKDDISNTYTLIEDNTGDNKNLLVDPEYAKGKKITVKKADRGSLYGCIYKG